VKPSRLKLFHVVREGEGSCRCSEPLRPDRAPAASSASAIGSHFVLGCQQCVGPADFAGLCGCVRVWCLYGCAPGGSVCRQSQHNRGLSAASNTLVGRYGPLFV